MTNNLYESPQEIGVSNSDLAYWRMGHLNNLPHHLEHGETISSDGHNKITKIGKIPYNHFHRQYLKHDGTSVGLRIHFNDHNFPNIPDKNGSYASQVIKHSSNDAYSDLKKIYDHELTNHDYLTTDKEHYRGGKNLWMKLTKDYEQEGKHLYLHDGQSHQAIIHHDIVNHPEHIWGDGDDFQHKRLIVSNHPL